MPENLAKVGNYRMNIMQKRSALEAQLKTAVQANLEEARTGLELLDHSYQLITSVRNKYGSPCFSCFFLFLLFNSSLLHLFASSLHFFGSSLFAFLLTSLTSLTCSYFSLLPFPGRSVVIISDKLFSFNMIDELCKGCQDLIGDYPLIRMVNTVRSNLYNTLREVDKMLAIPEKVGLVFSFSLSSLSFVLGLPPFPNISHSPISYSFHLFYLSVLLFIV